MPSPSTPATVELPAPPWGSDLDTPGTTPAAPAARPSYPARIGWGPAAQLEALGLYRDDLGRVRTKQGNLYVCAWSGRVRTHHLNPMPWADPWAGKVRAVWVDDDCLKEFRQGVIEGGRAKGSEVLRRFVGGLFGQALRFLGGL